MQFQTPTKLCLCSRNFFRFLKKNQMILFCRARQPLQKLYPIAPPLPPEGGSMDNSTTIQQLKDSVEKFKSDRNWSRYHTPQDLAVSISIEAAELLEIFQWGLRETDLNSEKLAHVKQELADVLIYCLSLANAIDIDVATIVNDKIKVNAEKYPVGEG